MAAAIAASRGCLPSTSGLITASTPSVLPPPIPPLVATSTSTSCSPSQALHIAATLSSPTPPLTSITPTSCIGPSCIPTQACHAIISPPPPTPATILTAWPLTALAPTQRLPPVPLPAQALGPISPSPQANAIIPTRIIYDVDDTPYELSYGELALYAEADLRRFAARAFRCALANVPQCSAETLISYIWQENTTSGFPFLLASSPTLLQASPRQDFETRIWPTETTSILLLYQGPSGIYEATYTVPAGPRSLAPVTVRRSAGSPAIFPAQGIIHVGTTVLVPPRFAADMAPTSGAPHTAVLESRHSDPTDFFTRSQQSVADTLLKAARKATEGNRLVSDILLDTEALVIISTNPLQASAQPLYNVLFSFISATPVQCPLSIVASLVRGITVLDPSHFVPLADTMDDGAARHIARQFLNHRSERDFGGRIVPLWNNDPARLHNALSSLFRLWGSIFLPDPPVVAELQSIASRIHVIAKQLPHWSIETNSYFWSLVLEQVGDILTTVGRTCTTVTDLVNRLRSVPNFITAPRAKTRLEMIWYSAECYAIQQAAVHDIIPNTAWIGEATFHLMPDANVYSGSDPDLDPPYDEEALASSPPAEYGTQRDQQCRPNRLPPRRGRR